MHFTSCPQEGQLTGLKENNSTCESLWFKSREKNLSTQRAWDLNGAAHSPVEKWSECRSARKLQCPGCSLQKPSRTLTAEFNVSLIQEQFLLGQHLHFQTSVYWNILSLLMNFLNVMCERYRHSIVTDTVGLMTDTMDYGEHANQTRMRPRACAYWVI